MSTVAETRAGAPARRSGLARKQAIEGYLCILPWLIGFLAFTLVPMVGALGLSFTEYEIITPPEFTGLRNFERVVRDPLFYTSLYNTAYIALLAVPLQQLVALALALALNQRLSGLTI